MNHLERRQSPFYASGQADGSVASRSGSGSGSHSHTSGQPLPAVTVPTPVPGSQSHNGGHHYHHPRIHQHHLYAPPSDHHEHAAVASLGGEGVPHNNHPVEDAWVSAGAPGGGGDYDYSEYSYPAAQQQQLQQHLDQQNEYGANPDYHHQHFYSQSQVERHEAGAKFDGRQQVHRSATQGDDDMLMYQEPAAEEHVDTPPTNDTVATPTSREAVAEKIVAAATDVHQAVQYALQLGAASSSSGSSSKTLDVVNGNDNKEKEDVDDDEFHHGMGRDQEGTAMTLADERGDRRRLGRERRKEEHPGGGAWSTNGGGGDDDGDEADDPLGGDGSTWTTYDRRRAARGVLRGLVALEETIEALSPSSSSMLAASMTHDNDSTTRIGDDDNANHHVGDGEVSSGTNAEANGIATLTTTLEELMIDLLMVPTAVRTSLLANMRKAGDTTSGEENKDCDGSHVGGRSGNVGNNGIVQLLDESDTIASRIVVQYLNKSTDPYRWLASLVPAQPLPPWNSVDGLLGRVFPQFVAVNGGKTYPAYRRTTATMLSVINTIGSVYAAQGLSIEIPAIDAFVLCHYLARRGLSDLTATNAPSAVLDGGEYGSGTDAVQEDAALQLRKLIVRVLGRLLECLAGVRAGVGTSTSSSKGLLHSLVVESQRLQTRGENSGTLVSTNDVEDCMDLLTEYCTEIMEYALDSLDSFNAQVKSAVSDESKIGDAHVEGLRESIRSVQIAAKTFSTLHQLGIHPEPSTLKSFVANLSDFWAISCNKLQRLARMPGGMTHHLAEDLQFTIDALGQQLIHISMLTRPRRAAITGGRQRGGNKSSKMNSKEEKSAHFVAIVNAVSQSQRGGGCDDLYALLHGFVKKSIGLETSQCRNTSGQLKCGDISRSNPFNRDAKRRRTKVSFEDDSSMDKNVPGNSYWKHDENDMDAIEGGNEGMDKEEPMFLVKKADEEGTADMNLVSACMFSSLLLPEFPSLAPHGNSGNDEGNYHPGASFEESYKTTAALATGMSIQSGSDDENMRSLVCDPTNPWHALIGRKIADTVSKRDASRIGLGGGADDVDSTLSNARGVLLHHARACQSWAS